MLFRNSSRFALPCRLRSTFRKAALLLAALPGLAVTTPIPAHAQSVTVTTIYTFPALNSGINDGGAGPLCLIQGSDGNFYGTTASGGAYGYGTVFQLTPGGAHTSLYDFNPRMNSAEGYSLLAGLTQAGDGNLYGTTEEGGLYGYGTVFGVSPLGGLTYAHSFTAPNWDGSYWSNADGAQPLGPLTLGSDGGLYGTTYYGGAYGSGVVFRLTTDGALSLVHSFDYFNTDPYNPSAGVVQGSDGNFYGFTMGGGAGGYGTLFQATPAGGASVLYPFGPFNPPDPAGDPSKMPALTQGADGALYGGTLEGAANGYGALFKITTGGALTVLHTFAQWPDPGGQMLASPVVQGSDGNLYGVAQGGQYNVGGTGGGVFFRVTPAGVYSVLYAFGGVAGEGAVPTWLIQGRDGNFYASFALVPGTSDTGAVCRISLSAPAPILKSLSPASVNAGGPAFILTVKGSNFLNGSTVNWNGSALTTTYVSSTQLKAAVPASLIAGPGTAHITVATPGAATSAAKSFTILATTLKMVSATLSRNSTTGVITANLSLKNMGYLTASNVRITKATLGAANTGSALPVSVGSIAAGASGSAGLSFPGSAGAAGTVVSLKVSGTFTGGTFSGSLKVTLP